jgi:hypothetical protein
MVEHPTFLRGARIGTDEPRPMILQRTDQEFLPAILKELSTPEGREKVRASLADERDTTRMLRLFQPVHRTFHVVLLEAVCQHFPEPRLDPARIESAGLVIRRLNQDDPGPPMYGWMQAEKKVRGWVGIIDADSLVDPDPTRRRPALRAGNAEVTRRMQQPSRVLDGFSESISPLFVAPPEVCGAAGRTLLYGLIPTASSEQTEMPPTGDVGYDTQEARDQLPDVLRAARNGRGGSYVLHPGDEERDTTFAEGLVFLFGLASQQGEAAVAPFFARFDFISAYDVEDGFQNNPVGLGGILRLAAGAFEGVPAPRVNATYYWNVTAQDEDRLAALLRGDLQKQVAGLSSGVARYGRRSARYHLRAFMRARVCDECPPELVWSDPSEDFEIVPWYESGHTPPVQITLPDVTSPAALKKLRPAVAFVAPSALFNRVRQIKMSALISGSVPKAEPQGPEFDIICGFNIPIITICALILLFIILYLLNYVFWWLPYVIICLPLPKKWPKLR